MNEIPPTKKNNPDLHAYSGQWIALVDDEIAGQGSTRQLALESAHGHTSGKRVRVRLVPPSDQVSLYTLLELVRPSLPKDKPIFLVGGAVRDHLLKRHP